MISFEKDREDSIRLLCKKSNVYENSDQWDTTPLDIAYEIDQCPSFIGHESVKHLLDSVWIGAMPIDIHWLKIPFMIIFSPFICWVKFDNEETIKYKKSHDVDHADVTDG